MDLSIVISLYNEEESLRELVSWIDRALEPHNITYELIMVDDGSTDGSWELIESLKNTYNNIRGIRFRRNYGKSAALYCGFEAAEGDIVVTMDADLQDSPEEIPEMMRMIREEGYDLVSGWKKKRYDNVATKNIPSKLYNATARRVTGIKLHDMNCGLKAYRKEVVKDIEVYGDLPLDRPDLFFTEETPIHTSSPYSIRHGNTARANSEWTVSSTDFSTCSRSGFSRNSGRSLCIFSGPWAQSPSSLVRCSPAF